MERRSRRCWTTMAEEATRTMQEQFTKVVDVFARQPFDLQAASTPSRQQAANVFAALRQEVRAPPWDADDGSRCGHTTAGKPRWLLGSLKCVAILECSVQGYAGAAVPRLQKLMTEAAKASMPISNAWRKTIGQRQFYWMMLIFCKEQHLTSCFWRVIVKVSRHGDN